MRYSDIDVWRSGGMFPYQMEGSVRIDGELCYFYMRNRHDVWSLEVGPFCKTEKPGIFLDHSKIPEGMNNSIPNWEWTGEACYMDDSIAMPLLHHLLSSDAYPPVRGKLPEYSVVIHHAEVFTAPARGESSGNAHEYNFFNIFEDTK
jgi:hypothetical protein